MIELLVFMLIAVDLLGTSPGQIAQLGPTGALLVFGGVLHAEIALRVERIRRRVTETAHNDLSSVWTFAAALLLPPGLAIGSVLALYVYLYCRVWRKAKVALYRQIYSTATVLLAVHAAIATQTYVSAGQQWIPPSSPLSIFAIIGSLLAYTAVNTCLVVGVVMLSANKPIREGLVRGEDVFLEVSTLSLGAIVAVVHSAATPLHLLLVLPPLIVLHRAVLVSQLEHAAITDTKTGLLTAAAWHQRANVELQRATQVGRSAAVLILDLDHFKLINDRHGHLAGDRVLAAVGNALRETVRGGDLVGRFGGEEFVVLLSRPQANPDPDATLEAVAERLRLTISELQVATSTADGPLTIASFTVSIGGARYPGDGADVTALIATADAALYVAKRGGRNQVRLSPHEPFSAPLNPAVHTQPSGA